jgi:hypothetical protein
VLSRRDPSQIAGLDRTPRFLKDRISDSAKLSTQPLPSTPIPLEWLSFLRAPKAGKGIPLNGTDRPLSWQPVQRFGHAWRSPRKGFSCFCSCR